jgi:hypothetical protein
MLFDSKLGFVVEQSVEHVGRIAHVCVDHLGVERRVLVGEMGIEQDAGLGAVLGVAVAGGFTVAVGAKPLAVARRCRAFAPVRCKRQFVLGVHEFGEAFRIRLVANMPSHQPREFAQTCARAGLRHLFQPQVECVRQDAG